MVLLASIPIALVALLAGLAVTGALFPKLVVDPGVAVTLGLPIARLVADGAAAVTIGLLTLATFNLPGQRKVPGVVSFPQWSAVRWAAVAAGLWVAAGLAVLVDLAVNYGEAGRSMAGAAPTFWVARHMQGPLGAFAVIAPAAYALTVFYLS